MLQTTTEATPEAIFAALKPYRAAIELVGFEAGNTTPWLQQGLSQRRLRVVVLDPRHAHASLAARINKTDGNDAFGLALLLAKGIYTTAHVKSDEGIRIRAVLALREGILRKYIDLKHLLHMTQKRLRGLAEPNASRSTGSAASLRVALESIRNGLAALQAERQKLDKVVADLALEIPLCRRFMAIPGIGPITALHFIATIDDPTRFKPSRMVGAYLGLTPFVRQSGATTRTGGISRRGDSATRKVLFSAGRVLLISSRSKWSLRKWGLRLAKAKGLNVAAIACARKLAVLMHHLWVTGEEFDPSR
jgi:transposase